MLRSFLYLINALLFLGGSAIVVIGAIDELSDPTTKVVSTLGDASMPPIYEGSGKVFVLFVDSLRDKTAESPDLMPNLSALAKTGTHARVETVYDAVTAPAIRAAFTGRSHFRVLGFVQNFVRRARSMPSLFSQLKTRGNTTLVYSDQKTFSQFGSDVTQERPNEGGQAVTETERENEQARAAVDQFNEGSDSFVLFHLLYLDHVAHKNGIGHADYRREVGELDALIGELAAKISDKDTFVVFGDHGHTETGRHALGLDVPTYVLLRGPGFRAGANLGLIDITSYRYLLSWALKLPLVVDYARERHPEAFVLAPGHQLPPSYALIDGKSPASSPGAAAQTRTGPLTTFVVLAMFVGLAFGLWWTVGELIRAGTMARFDLERFLKTLAASIVLAIPVMGVGIGLACLRTWVHEPFFPTMYQIWGCVLVVMLFLTRRFDLGALTLIVLGVPFLFLWPTTYRYGSPGVFGPAWFVWATCAFALSFGFKDGLPTAKYLAIGKRWKIRKSTLLFAAIIFLIQPFFFANASNFDFSEFVALSPEIVPTALWSQAMVASFATIVLFWRPKEGVANGLLTLGFVLYFLAIFFHVIPEGTRGNFYLGVALIAIAVGIRRKVRMGHFHAEAQGLARSVFMAALFVFYFYFVRVSSEFRLNAMMLFAALRLSLMMLDHLPMARRNVRLNALFLQIIGVIVAGWVTLAWGVTRLEWYAAYDFFPPRIVEEYVGLFLPFILLKYSVLVLISRMLIAERVRGTREYPAREVALFAGLKLATLTLLALGLGYYSAGSTVYLEATGELAIFLCLAGGLL